MRNCREGLAGAPYFFTVNLLNRKQTLLTDHIDMLRACIKTLKQRDPLTRSHAYLSLIFTCDFSLSMG